MRWGKKMEVRKIERICAFFLSLHCILIFLSVNGWVNQLLQGSTCSSSSGARRCNGARFNGRRLPRIVSPHHAPSHAGLVELRFFSFAYALYTLHVPSPAHAHHFFYFNMLSFYRQALELIRTIGDADEQHSCLCLLLTYLLKLSPYQSRGEMSQDERSTEFSLYFFLCRSNVLFPLLLSPNPLINLLLFVFFLLSNVFPCFSFTHSPSHRCSRSLFFPLLAYIPFRAEQVSCIVSHGSETCI